jgi:hypothetical protein
MQFLHRLLTPLTLLCFAWVCLAADTNPSKPDNSKPAAKDTAAKPVAKPAPPLKVQKFQAVVVWATDSEKPPEKDEELHPVEPDLKEKIKFLKWKNYFQVGDRKHVTISPGQTKEIALSHKCRLKLCADDKEGLKIDLIGEDKLVLSKKQNMPQKDILVIGGDDKDATAWLVVLRPENSSAEETSK